MSHAYTEEHLVEQPAIGLFAELGWKTMLAFEETFGQSGTLQRETKGEVILARRLEAALKKLDPSLPLEAVQTAMDEIGWDRSAILPEQANREVYLLLKEGVKVSVPGLGTEATKGDTSSGLRSPSPQRGEGEKGGAHGVGTVSGHS